MTVRYRISLDDFREAQRLIFRLSGAYKFLLFLCFPFGIFVVAQIGSMWHFRADAVRLNELWLNFRPLDLIVIGIVIFWKIVRPMQVKRAYVRNPNLRRDLTVDFQESGFRADDGAGNRSELQWNLFNRFVEGKRVFLLRTPGNIFHIISKSGMSGDQQDMVRRLLDENLPKRSKIEAVVSQ